MNHVSAEAPTTEWMKTMVILVLTKSKLLFDRQRQNSTLTYSIAIC